MGFRMGKMLTVITLCGLLAGCASTNEPGSVAAVRRVVGTDLIGVKGETPEDQRKIDRTIVGLCAPRIYTREECARHGALTNRPS